MIHRKTWEEFRNTGLFLFINSILHAFGWAIIIEADEDGKAIETSAYPARVKFRGFSDESTAKAHKKIGQYLKENASDLADESSL